MEHREKKVYKEIDELLWNEWDPIGVNDVEVARDEYYNYLPEVFRLKMQGAETENIANYLFKTETVTMGLFGDMERCRRIAAKVKAL